MLLPSCRETAFAWQREMNMQLRDIVERSAVPEPWAEGEKIPWDDLGFSRRMLAEHLSQAHDLASRRSDTIAAHVEWIQHTILENRPSRILDLGCGPGLYTARLASLGHECVGIDFAPAAIDYAAAAARDAQLRCAYLLGDIRTADYGTAFDLVMLIFGELNVFRPSDARVILGKARQALRDGGLLLIEVHTADAVRAMGESPRNWRAVKHGLFSDRPHLLLEEAVWDNARRVATERYFVIEAETSHVTRYAQSVQAYSEQDYHALLEESGFEVRKTATPFGWVGNSEELFVILAAAHRQR
jgi:SAM-dependent methyltransferase